MDAHSLAHALLDSVIAIFVEVHCLSVRPLQTRGEMHAPAGFGASLVK